MVKSQYIPKGVPRVDGLFTLLPSPPPGVELDLTSLPQGSPTPDQVEQTPAVLYRRAAARADPYYLAPLCFTTDMGVPMVPMPFHRDWLRAAMENDNLLLLAARGHCGMER